MAAICGYQEKSGFVFYCGLIRKTVNRTVPSSEFDSTAVSRARFLLGVGESESAERRVGRLSGRAREILGKVITASGLTPIYLWSACESPRVAALCMDSTGRFFAVESNRPELVSVAQGWAFSLACRGWADRRDVEDREAACQWEEAVLRKLQIAELDCPAAG